MVLLFVQLNTEALHLQGTRKVKDLMEVGETGSLLGFQLDQRHISKKISKENCSVCGKTATHFFHFFHMSGSLKYSSQCCQLCKILTRGSSSSRKIGKENGLILSGEICRTHVVCSSPEIMDEIVIISTDLYLSRSARRVLYD